MRRFVFDEWLWADRSGENGDQAQTETFQLLQAFSQRGRVSYGQVLLAQRLRDSPGRWPFLLAAGHSTAGTQAQVLDFDNPDNNWLAVNRFPTGANRFPGPLARGTKQATLCNTNGLVRRRATGWHKWACSADRPSFHDFSSRGFLRRSL